MKLALGTVQFGLDYGINNKRGKVPKKDVFEILKEALKNKIDVLDTAYAYGDSEKVIGEFIQKNNAKFKIISKLPSEGVNDIEKFFEESLKRLNCNDVYGYLVHDFKEFIKNPEKWSVLEGLKKQDKIKKIGFSLYSPEEIEQLLKKKIKFDIVQVPYSIFDQRFSKVFELLKKKNVEIHVRSVFLQGLVFKKSSKLKSNFTKIKKKLALLNDISKKIEVPISSLCINFALLNKNIDKIVIGIDSIENLKENIEVLKDKNKVKKVYDELSSLKEVDEKIILPSNWGK